MSTPPKINIEKRIFNLGNNETFLLEYPSNYEEIANKKIYRLEQEYESISNNFIKNNINIDNKQNEENKENINKKIIETNNNTNLINNKSKDNNNYYQQIGNVEIFSIDNEINYNNHNDNDRNNNNNDNMYLEPNEGIINIKNNQKEKKNINEKINEKENENNELNNEEFYEVEENEIPDNNNNGKEKNKTENNEKINKQNLSPVKNPENIKLSMKLLNFKAPKWAENLTDKDFINFAKNIISSKKNIP